MCTTPITMLIFILTELRNVSSVRGAVPDWVNAEGVGARSTGQSRTRRRRAPRRYRRPTCRCQRRRGSFRSRCLTRTSGDGCETQDARAAAHTHMYAQHTPSFSRTVHAQRVRASAQTWTYTSASNGRATARTRHSTQARKQKKRSEGAPVRLTLGNCGCLESRSGSKHA